MKRLEQRVAKLEIAIVNGDSQNETGSRDPGEVGREMAALQARYLANGQLLETPGGLALGEGLGCRERGMAGLFVAIGQGLLPVGEK